MSDKATGRFESERHVRERLAIEIVRAGGVRALAQEWGISPSHVSDMITGRRGPGGPLLDRLGLVKVVRVTYEPKPKRKDRS